MKFDESLTSFDIQIVLSLIRAIDDPLDDQLVIDSIVRDGTSYFLWGHLSDRGERVRYHFSFGKNIEGTRTLGQEDHISQTSYLITELLSSKDESVLLLLENGNAKSFIQTEERLFLEHQFPYNFQVVPLKDVEEFHYQKKKLK